MIIFLIIFLILFFTKKKDEQMSTVRIISMLLTVALFLLTL